MALNAHFLMKKEKKRKKQGVRNDRNESSLNRLKLNIKDKDFAKPSFLDSILLILFS